MTENNKDEFIEIARIKEEFIANASHCLLYTSPSPRDH